MAPGRDRQLQDLPDDQEERDENECLHESVGGDASGEVAELRRHAGGNQRQEDENFPRLPEEVETILAARVGDGLRVLLGREPVSGGRSRRGRYGRGPAGRGDLSEKRRRGVTRRRRERHEKENGPEAPPYIAGVGTGAVADWPHRRTRSVRFVWYSYVASRTRSVIR